jgi:hypothetical protein
MTAGASYDPSQSVSVELRFDSPHVVTYHAWYALAGGPWQKFATGTDEAGTAARGGGCPP